MSEHQVLILKAEEVQSTLVDREDEVMDAVSRAYQAHARGKSSLPHSGFLRFPDSDKDRIISLPAYLGDGFELAGMKWIASVPDNLGRDLERASAVMILNRRRTGRPFAILEGSIISKQRTAASAALGAKTLRRGVQPERIGFVGCGPINAEIGHFLSVVWPDVKHVSVCDLDPQRAATFIDGLGARFSKAEVNFVEKLPDLLASCDLIAFATNAVKPYVDDLSMCRPNTTLLHISLRDLAPELILANHNVVDDFSHVNRASTSIHLASQLGQGEGFVHGSIGELLLGEVDLPADDGKLKIYSPFGLGVLDLAVAHHVYRTAQAQGLGISIENFLP